MSKALPYAALLLAAFLAALVAGLTAYGKQMNHYASDFLMRLRGPAPKGDGRIVIVAIDDDTLRAHGAWPMERGIVAQALERICAGKPAVVGIDLLFPEASPGDAALERAIRGCPPTVLAATMVPGKAPEEKEARWQEAVPRLAHAAAATGHAFADPDEDGMSRQILLEKTARDTRHWALALECFRQMAAPPPTILETEDGLEWGDQRIPASRRAQRAVLINYAGDEGWFPTISMEKILAGQVGPQAFAGKVVLIGITAQGVPDRLFTPLSSSGIPMPGVEIHANLLRTLLERRFLLPLRDSTILGLELAMAGLMGVVLYFLRGVSLGTSILALGVGIHALPYVLLLNGQVAPGFSLAAAFWLPLIVCGTYQYLTVWRRFRAADATGRRLRQQIDFVAHEMRSPLTTIQGSSELGSRFPLDEKRRQQMFELIHRESQRLSRMVERFLDVERLSAGEIELRREPVDIRAVVETSAERIRPSADRKHIAVEAMLDDPGTALGDAELLEFAVYNLLGKDRKSTRLNSSHIQKSRMPSSA